MASFQLLKSPFSFSQSNPDFSTMVRRRFLRVRFQRKNPILNTFADTKFRVWCRVQDSGNQSSNGEEPPESLFMKELRRRGMAPTSLLEETNTNLKEDEETISREEDGGFYRRNALSTDSGRNLTNQREQSMALNSEGLEGLIPRAKLLLTLGGTFFLAFWPLILATIASFSAVYLYFGPQFVHDASNRLGPPPYIDPYVLLEEERISQTAPPLN
ncbi:PREDICTED: uncharacterized protein LOC109237349 [Nicotiana attenuata]|uniref:Tubulin alpha-6 chain n=1 Tax=Nicotiana attenuata TaxID=49451 RepID=A0A314LEB9_NICAT|nr:PREDICTED: uncharacterized protein LOC109237349 [Nicotiana attenuata]OIT40005.1 hypothetical protein A4A49_21772 [Nicotiana attenuata]